MQRLKILTTCYDYRPNLGGIATFTHELSLAMAKQPGVDLRLIAPAKEGATEMDQRDGLSVRRVPLPGHGIQAMLPMTMALGTELRSFKPDAILNTLWLPDGAGSLALSPFRSVPYFLCAYGMEFLESSATWKKRIREGLSPLKRQVFSKARGVFAISDFTRELAISVASADATKTSLVYCGVNADEFKPEAPSAELRRELGLHGKKVLLTVSRLDDYKGMDHAIAALTQVVTKYPDVVYLICGEGPDRARLERLVARHQMQKHVIFGGRVPQGRLRDYYNLADAFVLLSRNDWRAPNVEGFGIVFLEAAACEKPVIAGASGGIPDAVSDGVTGWLVDPTDDAAIARAMTECLDNPEEALRRGRAGRARVLDKFKWSDVARRVLDGIRDGIHVRD